MNEFDKIIEQYKSQLPEISKKIINSQEWKITLTEIAKKYSLDENQTFIMEREVLFVLIGIEPEEDLKDNLQNELSISDLLSNELFNEIDKRVISVIIKKFETESGQKNTVDEKNAEETDTDDEIFSIKLGNPKNEIIDTVPANLPTGEAEDGWFNRLVKSQGDQSKDVKHGIGQNPKPDLKIETPKSNTNFTTNKKDDFLPNIQKPKTASFGSFVDHKLNSPTESITQKNPQNNNPIKYNQSDPYREPLQ